MKPKVLVISDYRAFHTSRPEAELFIALAKSGFEIIVLTPKEAHYCKLFQEVGIKTVDFSPKKKFDKSEINTIRKVLVDEKVDILHIFNSKAIINGIRAVKGLPIKLVLYRGYSTGINWFDPTEYFKFLHPRVDKILCNSIGVERMFHRQLFFDKKKTIVINKGHDVAWYEAVKPYDIRKELKISSDTFLLICVANNRKMKGISYLLKAMSYFVGYPIHLILIGDQMDSKENVAFLNENVMSSQVHILKFREEVLSIIASCDAFVLPSIYGESITKSVIEAMALSIPPIISDIEGNLELVVNGESGLVFRSKDSKALSESIKKVYFDRELGKLMGRNAKDRIFNVLNNHQAVAKLRLFYEDLINH